jgi:RimJ/RimL family protein N-acetyltransferase
LKPCDGDGKVKLEYIPLTGTLLHLQPFVPELKAEVRAAVDCDPETWAIMPVNPMGDGFDLYWSATCGAPTRERMAYAIRRCSDDRVIGMSTYYTSLVSQGGVSIGTSFIHPSARGGAANPEAKLLMLDHAFKCGAVRVEFKVDTRNNRSQAAVTKLGAVREGVLRRDRLTWTGYIRDTVVFSILDHEWPPLKAQLRKRIDSLIAADLTKV